MLTLGSHIVGVEDQHPDNAGLACWLVGLPPTDGGGTLYDLTGNTSGAALRVGGAGTQWAATPFGQSAVVRGTGYSDAGRIAGVSLPAGGFRLSWWTILSGSGVNFSLAGLFGGPWKLSGTAYWLTSEGNAAVTESYPADDGRWHRFSWWFAGSGVSQPYVFSIDGQLRGSGTSHATSAVAAPAKLVLCGADTNGYPWSQPLGGVRLAGGVARDDGWAGRDFEWSQDPGRDPRFRRTSTRSLFVTTAGVPSYSFVPAFAPGWGW